MDLVGLRVVSSLVLTKSLLLACFGEIEGSLHAKPPDRVEIRTWYGISEIPTQDQVTDKIVEG